MFCFYTPLNPVWGQVILHNTLCKKLFDIRHIPGGRAWKLCRYLKYNLIELSDLIAFGYDLSDTQGEPI